MTPTRRWTSLLAALALALAACGGAASTDDEDSSSPTTAGGGGGGGGEGGEEVAADAAADACPVEALEGRTDPVPITFWHGMGAENEAVLARLTEEYNAGQDAVEVELEFQGTYDQIADKYQQTARSGADLPALVQLEETRIQFMLDSGTTMPAQVCVDASDYDLSDHLQPVLDEFTVDGQLQPMPFNVSNPVLYYNRAAFRRAGLDPDDPPTTFEEIVATARQLKESGASDTGYALTLEPWYVEQWFAKANQPLLDNDNGRSERATSLQLDSETGQEVFEFVDRLVEDGLAINVGRNVSSQDNLVAVGTGQASMTVATSAALGSILAVLAGGAFPDVELGVAPLPGPTEGGVLVGGAALWLVEEGSTPEERAAAFDYARFLNEPQSQATWHVGTGYLPIVEAAVALPEVQEKWEQDPEFRVAYDQLTESGADLGGPVVGPYFELREAITQALERVVLEDQDPAEAIDRAVEEADAAIADYNDRIGG